MSDAQRPDPVGPVPVGMEQVLLLVGVEPRFAEALQRTPEEALAASGVVLSDTERAILETVDADRLVKMAEQAVASVEEPTRRVFMGQATAAVLALGAGAGLVAGCSEKDTGSGKGGDGVMSTMARKRQRKVRRRDRVRAPTGIRPGPFPHLSTGEPKIDGPIDKKAVKRSLVGYSLSVRRCFVSKIRGRQPKITLRLDLTVGDKGQVSQASFGAGTLKSNEVESCILAAARGWKFAPSKPRPSKIQVSYTFEYRY